MISRGRHPKKEVADALQRANAAGLLVIPIHRAHRWGEMKCEPCKASWGVWTSPRNPGTHAKQIDRFVTEHTQCTVFEVPR